MAPRQNQPSNNSAAESVVFDNLGIDQNDLGSDQGSDLDLSGDDIDTGDQGDDRGEIDRSLDRRQQRQQPERRGEGLDDLSVSHTRPFAQGSEVRADARGNLVDGNGRIVARAGKEARLYQTAFKQGVQRGTSQGAGPATAQARDLSGRLTRAVEIGRELNAENVQFRAQTEALKKFNFTPEDQLNALQLFSDLKANPADALKKLLTRAAARGIDLTTLGTQGQNPADFKSLMDLVKEEIGKAVKPVQERTETERQRVEQEQRSADALRVVNEDVANFFSQNPDARPYTGAIKEVLSQPEFRHMTLPEVWLRIQLWNERNPRSRGANRQNSQRRGIPTGRGAPVNGTREMAPVNQSYDQILKDVMTELDGR